MLKQVSAILLVLFLSVVGLNAKPLVVGMELSFPPFEMKGSDGKPSGVSVDLAYALGKYLGREVEIKSMAWNSLIPSLQTKKIDLIISSMTITKKRQKIISFSTPYAQSSLAILTSKTSGIKSFSDLKKKGVKIAVKKKTTGHQYARKRLKKAKILPFLTEEPAIKAVIKNEADAFLFDQYSIYKSWNKNKDTTVALLTPFQKSPEEWGVAIKKGNSKLKTGVDKFIKIAKSDGTFDGLSKKYLKDARAKFDELGLKFFF